MYKASTNKAQAHKQYIEALKLVREKPNSSGRKLETLESFEVTNGRG